MEFVVLGVSPAMIFVLKQRLIQIRFRGFRQLTVATKLEQHVAALVTGFSCVWLIHWQLHVICAEPVTMGIAVGEQAALQHLVAGGPDGRHEVGRIEGRLFNFVTDLKEVIRIALESMATTPDECGQFLRSEPKRRLKISAL